MQNTAVVQTSMLALTDSQLAQLAIAATAVTAQGTVDSCRPYAISRYSLPTQQRFDAQERHVGGRRGGPCKSVCANRVECRTFFEVPYMSHRERTAWLGW